MIPIWGTSTGLNPTLDLQFAGATSLDNRITFSRGSQATLFDSTGALVYAKHNLLTYSEQFDNAAWTQFQSSVTANATTAPNATATADKFIPNATFNGHYLISSSTSMTSGATYVGTVYAKASEQTVLQLTFQSASHGSTYFANFNLSNGTLGTTGGAGVVATITPISDGWYRCSIAAAAISTASAGLVVLSATSTTDGRLPTYTGDGTSGLFIWGAQLNQAPMEGGVTSSLSTYYPTVASAYYAPRFDYNPSTLQPLGLLIEEQRTNSIRNNTMQGAVAGTPGTLPTNWFRDASSTGLSSEVVGTGTDGGITYLDFRVFGTAATANYYAIYFENAAQIVAANGETWTNSFYLKLAGGSTSGLDPARFPAACINENTSAGSYVTGQEGIGVTPTSAWQRVSTTRTLNGGATVARVLPFILFRVNNGAAINITLRVGLPQMEQGAFATSVIPTTTTALTRNADVASMTGTNFLSWFNASEGTIVSTTQLANTVAVNRAGYDINDNSINNRIIFRVITTGGLDQSTIRSGGITQVQDSTSTAPTTAVRKSAIAYKVNDFAFVANAGAVVADSSGAVPVAPTQILIGSAQGGGEFTGGYIQRISFWPIRLANSQLQALTS